MKGKLAVQDDIEEGIVDFQLTVLFNEAQLPKLIHEILSRDR